MGSFVRFSTNEILAGIHKPEMTVRKRSPSARFDVRSGANHFCGIFKATVRVLPGQRDHEPNQRAVPNGGYMQRRKALFAILKTAAFGLVAHALVAEQEQLDPLKIMPDTHKLLFENEFVRVIESKVPAGGSEPRHSHPHCVIVSLADFDAEIKTFPDGNVTRVHRTFGATSWSEATVHEVKIVRNNGSHNIRVELKH
jgi:hypothetical protein